MKIRVDQFCIVPRLHNTMLCNTNVSMLAISRRPKLAHHALIRLLVFNVFVRGFYFPPPFLSAVIVFIFFHFLKSHLLGLSVLHAFVVHCTDCAQLESNSCISHHHSMYRTLYSVCSNNVLQYAYQFVKNVCQSDIKVICGSSICQGFCHVRGFMTRSLSYSLMTTIIEPFFDTIAGMGARSVIVAASTITTR